MRAWYRKNGKLVLSLCFVFFLSLFALICFGNLVNNSDAMWNYGFSYSIARGQVPYRDFTMIIPPAYNFLMSIGLILFSHNNIVFIVEQSFIITLTFYFLYKIYSDKAFIFLLAMCFPTFINFAPSYNFFLFFLTVLLIYCDKFEKSDYFIGMILGFMLLTKYTTGLFLILPSLIGCYKNKKKLFKRIIGLVIPCLVFLFYLIFTKSLYNFIDLCFLGLFDFGKDNSEIFTIYFFLSLPLFLYSLYFLIKNKKNIVAWIVVLAYIIMFPNVSAIHLYIYLLFFSLLIMSLNFGAFAKKVKKFSILITISLVIIFYILTGTTGLGRLNVHNFNYFYVNSSAVGAFNLANDLYTEYSKKSNTYYLGEKYIWFQIINEEDTNYFTILNKGNYGYNGTKKMINRAKNIHDAYFIVNLDEYDAGIKGKIMSQLDINIIDFIMENSEKVYSKNNYIVYYKK